MRGTLDTLLPVLALSWRDQKRRFLAGLALAALTVLSGLALLGLSGWFITATGLAGATAATALAFDVFAPSAGIRLLALTRTASRYGERLVTHDVTLRALAALRETLFRSWAEARAASDLLLRPAKGLFRFSQDVDALDSLYLRVIVPGGAALATAAVAGFALALIDPWLGIAVATLLLLVGLGVPLATALVSRRAVRGRAHATETLRSRTIDLVQGQTELLLAGRLHSHVEAIATAERRAAEADDTLNMIEVGAGAAFGVASALLLAGVLLATAGLAHDGRITAPIAALAILITLAAFEPFAALRRGAVELGRTLLAARRLSPRLSAPVVAPSIAQPADDRALSLHAVSARRGHTNHDVVRGVTFSLRPGERLALIGPSGSGKSSLLALLAGELEPIAGQLERRACTLLTQRTELFADTLRDNLRLADPEADDARLGEAMAAAGLGTYLASLPSGLDTRLGEGGLGLSGGEARRLALARLVLRDTPIWLLDEPTEGLDADTARDVMERLDRLSQRRTLVIATHVRREAEIADHLLRIDGGEAGAMCVRGSQSFDAVLAELRQG